MTKSFFVAVVFMALAVFVLGQAPPATTSVQQPQTAAPAAAPSGAPGAGPHKVTFQRPSVVGESYKLSVDFKMRSEGGVGLGGDTMGGGAEEEAAIFSGTVRVLEVNSLGEATKLMVHVDKAESTSGKETKPMKIAGADLGIAFPFNQTHIVRRDGQAVDKGDEMLLSQIFQPPTGISADDYMGPGKEVKPGDTWPVNKEVLAKVLSGPGAEQKDPKEPKKGMDPSKLEGTVTFAGVETWEGLPCDHFTSQIAIKNVEQPRFVGEITTEIKLDQLVPQDTKVKKTKETTEYFSSVRGKYVSEDGKTMDIRSKNKMTMVVTVH